MVYRFHYNSSSLLFCTLLTSAILLYFIHLPILLEAYAIQASNYLNMNHTNIQNLDVKNKRFAIASLISTDTSAVNNTNSKRATANVTDGMNVIERVSDKGKYKIQLKSNESFNFLPKKGFDMQILFLNASSSSAQSSNNNNTISQMKQLLPVNGFDITIYSNNGKILWQKTNQIINAATAFENITFANGGYSGGITVQITNIKPSPVPIGTAIPLGSNNTDAIIGSTANSRTPTDSVTFAASILK
jgi:hypothetical protein